ncbi:MAG: choice-of-anchor Q domain-containing protein [Anaerolineales bacterium]
MRKIILPFIFIFLFVIGVLFLIAPAQAASTITVTTTSDIIASDGMCSLREAVIAANTDSPFNDCPGGSGADTINFSPSLSSTAIFTLTLTGANEDSALTGDLDILGSLTINGNGSNYTIFDGNKTDRIFDIRPGAHVTISGVTVRNGSLTNSNEGSGIRVMGSFTFTDSTITSNQGGGIFNNGGEMVLTTIDITNNTGGYGLSNQNQAHLTYNGGLIEGNQGGGIYNYTSTVTLANLFINNNSGSGVTNTGATISHLTIDDSTISNNSTAQNGGGILNSGVGAIASITTTSIRSNSASVAGGGAFNNGIMSISNSTLSQNQARTGGGIDHYGGNLSLINDTLSGNSVLDNGGGLYNRAAAVLTNLTINANTANGAGTGGNIFNDTASLSVKNTIVADSDIDGNCFNSDGFINSLGNNLESADTCGFNAAGDFVNTQPMLGPLQNNGGQTDTEALLAGSPAINAGTNTDCPSTDQRGVNRPQGITCDIGAYELVDGNQADIAITVVDASDPVLVGDLITYTLTISNAGPDSAQNIILTDNLPLGVSFLSAVPTQGSCYQAGGVVSCNLGNLPNEGNAQVKLTVNGDVPGLVTNSMDITADTPDPDLLNNTTNIQTTIYMWIFLPFINK